MNEIINTEEVVNMIHVLKGVEVMLDTDLAKLYNVETKRINEAVKNNPERFPQRYIFRISEDEYNSLKSKISTSKGGSRKGHTAFTEQGVYMLATILKSKIATEVSIRIMDTFVKMRHYINFNKYILPYKFLLLENKVDENTRKIDELFNKFNPKDIVKSCVIYKGELYDAFSLFMDILGKAKRKITIIDNYASKELFDMLKNFKIDVIVVSKNVDENLRKRYESQYKNVKVLFNDDYHDRFIVIDNKRLYVSGASFKDMGKGCFALYEITTDDVKKHFIGELNKKISNII